MLRVGLHGDDASKERVASYFVEHGAELESPLAQRPWQHTLERIILVDLDNSAKSDAQRSVPTQFDVECLAIGHPGSRSVTAMALPPGRDFSIQPRNRTRQWHQALDELWRKRLVPFEFNLRSSLRAPRSALALLSEPRAGWSNDASLLMKRVMGVAAPRILRIDHIGSTSVTGLPAKDLIDIQIVVEGPSSGQGVIDRAGEAGLVHASGEWFAVSSAGERYREQVMVDADPGRPVNVNVRDVATPIWRDTLLFRDFLRAHPRERDEYAASKAEIATRFGFDVDVYGEEKLPWIFEALGRARKWATQVAWTPSPNA